TLFRLRRNTYRSREHTVRSSVMRPTAHDARRRRGLLSRGQRKRRRSEDRRPVRPEIRTSEVGGYAEEEGPAERIVGARQGVAVAETGRRGDARDDRRILVEQVRDAPT